MDTTVNNIGLSVCFTLGRSKNTHKIDFNMFE